MFDFAKPKRPVSHPRFARGLRVAAQLRAGELLTDAEFDALYPLPVRTMSTTFWTPVHIARRAAELLVSKTETRVLDIGSGAGKFCLLGAATTGARFFGVEQREAMVECARDVASLLDPLRASFTHGRFDTLSPEDYDAFYLFNPFEENRYFQPQHDDFTVPLSNDRFHDDVLRAQKFLGNARAGARVVTYNGMGGPLPAGYDLIERERLGCVLELWVKGA